MPLQPANGSLNPQLNVSLEEFFVLFWFLKLKSLLVIHTFLSSEIHYQHFGRRNQISNLKMLNSGFEENWNLVDVSLLYFVLVSLTETEKPFLFQF